MSNSDIILYGIIFIGMFVNYLAEFINIVYLTSNVTQISLKIQKDNKLPPLDILIQKISFESLQKGDYYTRTVPNTSPELYNIN